MAESRSNLPSDPSQPQLAVSEYTPKSAFLEFGSTSIKLYVVGEGGQSQGAVEQEAKVPWTLGYDVFQHQRISPRTVNHCVETLRRLQREFPDIPLKTATAVGTAALREAQNAEVFLRVLRQQLGITLHIIEGGIEAFLLETGFRDSIETYPTGLFDLGGGSLELVEYLTPSSTKKTSLPVGAIRLHCSLRHTRDLFEYIAEGRRTVAETLQDHFAEGVPRYRALIGTGGTVRAVVQILQKNEFTAEDLGEVLQSEIHGPVWDALPRHRRKLILPGILAIEGLFTFMGLQEVRYRTASVKRGLMTLMSLLPPAEAAAV